MSIPPDFDPGDPTQVEPGRRFPFHTAGDWVFLAIDPQTGRALKATAKALYSLLRMHANRDDRAWPSTETLAEMLGLSRGDKVTPYLQALARVGAIDIEVYRTGANRMRKRNRYTVHEAPSSEYEGFLSLSQFYAARQDLREQLQENTRALGESPGQPGDPENGGSAPGATGADDAPETPKTGAPNEDPPEPPKTGAPDTPKTGAPDTPKRGHEPHQPRTTPKKKNYGEEEAARERAGAEPSAEENPTTPEPSFFALVSIRNICEAAMNARTTDVPELLGDTEVYELAAAFDAETARLALHRPDRAGGDLALWLGRGLATAESLYAVLRSRLRPGHATSKIVRPKKNASPESSQNDASREDDARTCSVHPEQPAHTCAPCQRSEERHRAQQARAARSGGSAARRALEEAKQHAQATS